MTDAPPCGSYSELGYDAINDLVCLQKGIGTWHWRCQMPGKRYRIRKAPLWMHMNLHAGLCWCGKPKGMFEPRQRKYCTELHAHIWFFHILQVWQNFRKYIFQRDGYACAKCDYKNAANAYGGHSDRWLEADHILAISLGGMCFDESNLQTLCVGCHAKKTITDKAKLANARRAKQPITAKPQSRAIEAAL